MLTPEERETEPPPRYEAFVLRLRWMSVAGERQCQVMLQAADQSATNYFGSLEDLLQFLRARSSGGPPADAPPQSAAADGFNKEQSFSQDKSPPQMDADSARLKIWRETT